jgi:hypothetical protein
VASTQSLGDDPRCAYLLERGLRMLVEVAAHRDQLLHGVLGERVDQRLHVGPRDGR